MSPNIITGIKDSSTATGVILLDHPCRKLDIIEYGALLTQIYAEDENLDCIPKEAMLCTMNGKTDYCIWMLPNYRRNT